MNRTVRTGLVTASLLAALAGLAAAPASAEPRAHAPAPPTLATFTGVFAIGRHTRYTYTMVGTNPQVRRARNVVVPVRIIPLRLEFSDGTVLDPSQPDTCLGGRTPLDVTLQSPLFQDFDYGEGRRQFLEQIRRLEFWQFTAPGKLNANYSVRLSPSVLPTQTLALSPASVARQTTCFSNGAPHAAGHVDIDDWGHLILSQVVPQFPTLGVNGSTFVLFLLPAVDFTENGDAVAVAFHDALPTPQGVVTFAAAQLGLVRPGNLVNFGALSHEFAEWLDDPYGNNATPAWGHVGQVPDCQADLEVGDPLTGTYLPAVQMPNGISYQLQETAFLSWFFHQVPSFGFDGWYSSGGTFRSPAAPCH